MTGDNLDVLSIATQLENQRKIMDAEITNISQQANHHLQQQSLQRSIDNTQQHLSNANSQIARLYARIAELEEENKELTIKQLRMEQAATVEQRKNYPSRLSEAQETIKSLEESVKQLNREIKQYQLTYRLAMKSTDHLLKLLKVEKPFLPMYEHVFTSMTNIASAALGVQFKALEHHQALKPDIEKDIG